MTPNPVPRLALRRYETGLLSLPLQSGVDDTTIVAAAAGFALGVITVTVVVIVQHQLWNRPSSPPVRPSSGHSGTRFETFRYDRKVDRALTDEERIVELLLARGGRMKQSRIVEETDWSKAKVSRLLSKMEHRGDVTKVARGRENIVLLGSEEVADARNRIS